MGLGLSPFVVAGARDQMRADEQMEWQREDQQFRRGQREREVKRAAVADELFADRMTDYRDERAFAGGMRDVARQNAGASRFDFTTALEEFARRNGRVEVADSFRASRENGHLEVMKRVVTAASSGADAARIAGILNEGRPASEQIDPAELQLQTDENGRTTGLVMRGPQGRPVPINLNEWGLMTGLIRPTNIDIKDNVMTVANGDGSQSIVTFENGRLVFKKNPNHVPDPERGPGRSGATGGAGSGAPGGGNIVAYENALRDAIKDFPQFVDRDAVNGSMRGINPEGQRVLSIAASLGMGSRQGMVQNGAAREAGPASFESPTAALRVASDPTGRWKEVELDQNGRRTRATAWVIKDPASGGEVAYFPNNPIQRDVPQIEQLQRLPGFQSAVEAVREAMADPVRQAEIAEGVQSNPRIRALVDFINRAQQNGPQMPAGVAPSNAPIVPARGVPTTTPAGPPQPGQPQGALGLQMLRRAVNAVTSTDPDEVITLTGQRRGIPQP
ncbi:MAG: hypothetical protein ING91_19530 [Rhodocyclaceae bacterium]|nr:hypothetical protein [Rhodocyclaceae bacterium]MCA3129460.1 hypothetical protein [Rhodocyclaceae bacterium]MCA3848767.1 hypothetical protein [Burkholderia sp.]